MRPFAKLGVALGVLSALSSLNADTGKAAFVISTTRESIALTIYDQHFALVSENRPLSLKAGANTIVLQAISPLIDSSSVLLRWDARSVLRPEIVAHGYDMGVRDTDELLRRYIGKSVRVRRYNSEGKPAGDLEGVLVSADEKGIVIAGVDTARDVPSNGLHVNPQGVLILPDTGDDPTLPALRVQVQSPQTGEATLSTSYMTGGLDWDADYIAVLHGNSQMQLQLWATVTNQTGLSFPEARLTLVTGAQPPESVRTLTLEWMGKRAVELGFAGARPQMLGAPRPLGELYSYPVARVVSLSDSQQSRVLLHEALSVPVRKRYVYRAPILVPGGASPISRDAYRTQAEIVLAFENRKEHGLGLPLPQGSVRLYGQGANGTLQYLGAGNLPAVPNGGRTELSFGRAFDLVGEWLPLKQTGGAKGKTLYEVRITLRNAKPQPVDIQVVQPFSGAWRIVQSTHSHTRLSATAAQWTVRVPANGTAQVQFTAEIRAL
ncbi:MAG: DUF4139 domain-containing protein [Fimbriimonadales bacterium]|nr:DUF4139 domain-containing protein [Fimbriimonadales bacterium]